MVDLVIIYRAFFRHNFTQKVSIFVLILFFASSCIFQKNTPGDSGESTSSGPLATDEPLDTTTTVVSSSTTTVTPSSTTSVAAPSTSTVLPPDPQDFGVDLSWDTNTDSDLAGYKIYYGVSSEEYTEVLDIGFVAGSNARVNYRLNGLSDGQIYYFAVSAYDTSKK